MSGVKNFGLAFVAPKLSEFLLFDNSFLNLANFWDLDNFLPFEFPNFLAISLSSSILNLLTSPSPTPSYLGVNFSGGIIIFNIEVSKVAILLKSWMNC